MKQNPFSESNLNPPNVRKTATSIKVPITNNISFVAGSRTDGVGANRISMVKPYEFSKLRKSLTKNIGLSIEKPKRLYG